MYGIGWAVGGELALACGEPLIGYIWKYGCNGFGQPWADVVAALADVV